MIRLFQSKPNNYSFWFVSIQHYSTFYSESCWNIHLVLLRFASFYDSNRLFFNSFWFVSGYRLYRFNSTMNQITKTTIRLSLMARGYGTLIQIIYCPNIIGIVYPYNGMLQHSFSKELFKSSLQHLLCPPWTKLACLQARGHRPRDSHKG